MNLSRVAERYYARSREILGTMTLAMTTALETDSVSHNFIVQMIPHHQAAVEMAQNLLQYTTCVPLQELADRIIIEQTRGVETMQDALPDCGRPQNTETELARYAARYRRITETMFARMGAACESANLNAGFLLRMLPHHEGAVEMARNALRLPVCETLRPTLCGIIDTQSQELAEMRRLLRRL